MTALKQTKNKEGLKLMKVLQGIFLGMAVVLSLAVRADYCYEKALAMIKLGRVAEAKAIGEAMVAKGSRVLADYVDFFDYEGNRYGSTKDAKNRAAAKTRKLGERILEAMR